MDVFIEKIVEKKKTQIDTLLTIVTYIGAFVVMFLLFVFIPVLNTVAPIIAIGLGYLAYQFSKSRNIEYEYSVTNGELDIDTIIDKTKRKRLYTGKAKEFEILAKVNGKHFKDEYKNISKRIESVRSMNSEDVYFIVTTYKSEKTIIFFEPNKKMLDSFRFFNASKVFDII